MYVEFGSESTDSVDVTTSYVAGTKNWNILATQIACTAAWKYEFANLEIFQNEYLKGSN